MLDTFQGSNSAENVRTNARGCRNTRAYVSTGRKKVGVSAQETVLRGKCLGVEIKVGAEAKRGRKKWGQKSRVEKKCMQVEKKVGVEGQGREKMEAGTNMTSSDYVWWQV